jgi:hypothetical protein
VWPITRTLNTIVGVLGLPHISRSGIETATSGTFTFGVLYDVQDNSVDRVESAGSMINGSSNGSLHSARTRKLYVVPSYKFVAMQEGTSKFSIKCLRIYSTPFYEDKGYLVWQPCGLTSEESSKLCHSPKSTSVMTYLGLPSIYAWVCFYANVQSKHSHSRLSYCTSRQYSVSIWISAFGAYL